MNAINSVDKQNYFNLRLYLIKMQTIKAYTVKWDEKIKITEFLPSSLVDSYTRFGGTCCLHLHSISKDIDSRFSLNVATYLPEYKESHLGRP